MVNKKEISQDVEKKLLKRIDMLEKKLESFEKKDSKKKKEKGNDTNNLMDSITDTSEKIIKESSKIISSMADATAEGMKESINTLSTYSEKNGKKAKEEISSVVMSIFRKTLDIQKNVLDKFEESYKKFDK